MAAARLVIMGTCSQPCSRPTDVLEPHNSSVRLNPSPVALFWYRDMIKDYFLMLTILASLDSPSTKHASPVSQPVSRLSPFL